MKISFLIMVLLFPLGSSVYPQMLDISLSVTDGVQTFNQLRFGIDSTATDGIDPHLGESELPPGPPTGMFEARFDLSPYIGSWVTTYRDYRYAPSLPYVGIKEHRLIWQLSSNGTAFTINYNFPSGVSAIIRDDIVGYIFNAILTDSGSYTVPYNFITSASLIIYYNSLPVYPTPGIYIAPDTIVQFGGLHGDILSSPITITNTDSIIFLSIDSCKSSSDSVFITPDNFPNLIFPNQSKTFFVNTVIDSARKNSYIDIYNNSDHSPYRVNIISNLVTGETGYLNIRSGQFNQLLVFGLDSLGTDGIDYILGEQGFAWGPDPGSFNALMVLPENNFSGISCSHRDYRYGLPGFVGQKEFMIIYEPYLDSSIIINWILPEGLTGIIQDIVTGSLINFDVSGQGSYIITNPAAFYKLRMIINFNLITPVELTSFSAVKSDNSLLLNWQTATELNNYGFEIERKVGSHQSSVYNFENIGFVNGNGTTTEPRSYSFIDTKVSAGKYSYRLKQINTDGQFEYSKTIEVDMSDVNKYELNQNYPNPFNPTTTIQYGLLQTGMVKLTLYNILGQEIRILVNEVIEAGTHTFNFNASELNSGVYIYKIESGSFTQTKKMTLVK